jgi:hypothetical protein
MDDPLNLMRVMPTQGGQPCSSARLYFLTTNGANGMSDIEGKGARVAPSETGAERVSIYTNRHEAESETADYTDKTDGLVK